MALYNDLSNFYDVVFAVSEAELAFVSASLPPEARLLDVGCGTGNKTVVFAKNAQSVVGIDPDESMIDRAKRHNGSDNILYRVGGMEVLATSFAPEAFSAVTCLGNTLVHLTDTVSIQKALSDMFVLLCEGGVFMGQILHYDFILRSHMTVLPILDTDEVTFERRYDLTQRPIQFVTTIYDKVKGKQYHNETPLYPLLRGELETMLGQAGFSGIEFFGSYAGGALQEDSLPLIVRARK